MAQRGIDTAAELSDVLAQKLSSAADPRAKQLRKRKWALWLTLFFGVSCLIWVGVTVLLATWSTPAWALFISAPIAVGAAFLATLVVPALPLAARGAAAPAAFPRHPQAATVRLGRQTADGRARRIRARIVLADQRDGAGQDVACGRVA